MQFYFLMTLLRTLRRAAAFVVPSLALSLAAPAGAQVVISQIYGAGGNSGSTLRNDFVELHNAGTFAVSVNGYSVQYASSTGNTWAVTALPNKVIPPGGFFLVSQASGGANGAALPSADFTGSVSMANANGKVALVNGTVELSALCPTGILDFVPYGTTNCSPSAPAPSATTSVARKNAGCQRTGDNLNDFATQAASASSVRNSASTAQFCTLPCGPGIALTTSPTALWQQLSLACVPTGTSTVDAVLGGGTTGKLDSANYGTRWSIWQRTPTNSGNVQMSLADTITAGSGHWIKSLDAPAGGTLIINSAQATATPLTTGLSGCQATNAQGGCVVLPVASATAGARMIANPLPYDIDWSKARVRVGGSGGTVYTPSAAQTAAILSNQIWIYNGNTYATWSDTSPNIGNLQYFKSFFVNVRAGGVGQIIDLLIPALGSTIPPAAATPLPDMGVQQAGAGAAARSPLAQGPDSRVSRSAWVVNLGVQDVDTGWSATAKLGQWPGSSAGRDANDLDAMAPFAQPYLTVVFPRSARQADPGDYVADLRPDNGWASTWDFEVRAQPLGSQVVLRWNAPAAVLAKSRLIDRDTGLVVTVTDPSYANGYPMTLDTPVRRLTWEYMGN